MSRLARGTRPSRIGPFSWVGALAVHAVIVGLLLQFGTEPAQSKVPTRPEVEAVRVQAADEALLEQRREAHRRALREEELRKQREREAKRKEAERKREQEAHRKAEEKKAEARAEAKRKAKEEAKRKLAEKRKREEAARRKAEEEARQLMEAEQRAEARRQEQAQRRQREAARRARQADIWRIAIKKRIERVWLRPPAAGDIAPCEAVVEQDERGVVLSVGVRACRASQAWQDSLRNAVLKASPLPRPPVAELFDRYLVITFRPKAPR